MSKEEDLYRGLDRVIMRHLPTDAGTIVNVLARLVLRVFSAAPPEIRAEAMEAFCDNMQREVRKTLQTLQ